MLVLSRGPSERIRIGDDIWLMVVRIGPNSVRIGIDAPSHVRVVREELLSAPETPSTSSTKEDANVPV